MSGRIFVKAFKITIAVEVLTTISYLFLNYFNFCRPLEKKFCSLGSVRVPFRPLGKDSKIKKRRRADVCVDTATPLQTSNESTFALRF